MRSALLCGRSQYTNSRGSAIAAAKEGKLRMRKLHRIGSLGAASLGRRALVLAFAGALLTIGAQSAAAATAPASWLFGGSDITNSRTQPAETKLSRDNVGGLAVKWTAPTHGDVSATPTVANGVVYFPDWGGYINAVDANTGAVIWQNPISAYEPTGVTGAFSRTSPAIYGNEVIFGDNFNSAQPYGARVFAVNAKTGVLIWSTQVDTNIAAVVTANPVVAGGKLIVGVSSNEEGDATSFGYPCCTFRGKVLALDPNTGGILWSNYTVPSSSGGGDSNLPCTGSSLTGDSGPTGCDYSGGAVWDTPAVDLSNGMVFVGSGNNYTAPDSAVACEQNAQANNTSDANCTDPTDYFDSVLALNLKTGSIVWGHKVAGWDAWSVACFFLPPGVTWCPSPLSPDFDFGGSGPNLIKLQDSKGTLVGVGQKSGVYWAFDEMTGKTVWSTLVGPGSALGGIEWGTAYDGHRIYVPIANSYGIPYTLANGQTSTAGSWAALDPGTGKFDWQVPTPDGSSLGIGPASEANGVVYVGDTAAGGTNNMFALNASNGNIMWSFAASGSVFSAPAIANGVVYWGSGYSHIPGYTPGSNTFYAFSFKGR